MSLPETYKAIQPDEKGQPILKEFPLQKPSTDQVLVRVEYATLSPVEIHFLALGTPANTPNSRYGFEGSGIVVAVGDNLKRSFKVGDRVHVGDGSWSQYLLAKSEDVYPVLQKDIPLEDVCAHYVNPVTVHHMGAVAEKGGHKAVIVTAAGSLLGRMAIKYFSLKGIKIICVVRRNEHIKELKEEGADYVLNSQAPDFEDKLKELAEKENATLSFDAVAGDFTNKILASQPPGSTCLVYGLLSGHTVNGISIMELFKKKRLGGLLATEHIADYEKQGQKQKLFTELHELLPTAFKSRIHKIFKFEDIQDAFAEFKATSSVGKIVLKVN